MIRASTALAALVALTAPLCAQRLERSVVRIINRDQTPNWYAPWNAPGPGEGSGTGFLIDGGRIMTNAHVVSNARVLYVFLYGDPRPHEASVQAVGHDCDLALVELRDPSVLEGITPLQFGALPTLRSQVETYGYPAGGETLSSTRGVVSRIEMQMYSHSGTSEHLAVQTDAAINPGNSGGPVVQDGRVVGVAFQVAGDLDNVGYFIPDSVVQHFLADASDGSYDGFPDLAIVSANMENPAARRHAKMSDAQTGVRVELIEPTGCSKGVLQHGDVLLAADGLDIANDGTVALGPLRVRYQAIVDRRQIGDRLPLDVLRGGEVLRVEVPLARYPRQDQRSRAYDRWPRYYVYGGLVFVPLEWQLLSTFGQGTWTKAEYLDELYRRPVRDRDFDKVESVVLLRRLDHAVNVRSAWAADVVVEKVNGVAIKSLQHLVETIESSESEHVVFEYAHRRAFGVLDRAAAEAANPQILSRYGIPSDRRL